MKLIGIELRVGIGAGMQVHEIKLVPVEIIIPVPPNQPYSNGPEAELTYHCDAGDVTTPRTRLPVGPVDYDDLAKWGFKTHEVQDAFSIDRAFRRYLETIRV